MRTAFEITITQGTIGVLAVMFLTALALGSAVWLITGIVLFGHMDRGGAVANTIAVARWPVIFLAVLSGGWVGYHFMQ